jgi:hypothetical protein
MNPRNTSLFLLLAFCSISQAMSPATSMTQVPRGGLCITEGDLTEGSGNMLSVDVPKMRAFVTGPTLQEVEAQFKYRGPSAESIPLGSGAMRRQFGLKLSAQDACNLVYAMWRIEPENELVVSVKSNPGMTRSAECGNRGYHNIKPARTGKLPAIGPGKTYTLRAILSHGNLRVYANNQIVWQGDLGAAALAFDGPVGVRTDNGHFDFQLFAAMAGPGQHGATAVCRAGEHEE